MSAHQVEETPKIEVPLSLFVKAKFSELSEELAGVAYSADTTSSGKSLARGKPLSKLRSRMDLYKVSRAVYNFAPTTLDGPFRDCDVRKPESVTIPSSMLQRLEQDARVLTLIGSFLDCSGFSTNSLLDEASLDP